jgi:hypothetical protein
VDIVLNESQLMIINKYYKALDLDKIREVVITEHRLNAALWLEDTYRAVLPTNFLHYISGHVLIQKKGCVRVITPTQSSITEAVEEQEQEAQLAIALPPTPQSAQEKITVRADLIPKQHIDIHVDSELDSSSFEWRQVNYNFSEGYMLMYANNTFNVVQAHITYIRLPKRIVSLPSYKLPNGETVTYQDCELHESLHNEIVDLAVLIASTDLQMKDINIKEQKVKLN